MAQPSPLFTIDGGDPGEKASVAASATVTCALDDTTGVVYVEWFIDTTDETTAPGDYTLSTTGGVVPGNETMTFTAGIAGTGGLIRCRINNGVDLVTGNADASATESTALWFVPTTVGSYEVFVDGEEGQSDLEHGQTPKLNQLIRAIGSGGSAGAFSYIELGAGTKPTTGLVRVATGAEIITARTASGGFNNPLLSDDGADGAVIGGATRCALIDLATKTGGSVRIRVNGTTEATLDASGILLATGNTYQVNGASFGASSLTFTAASGPTISQTQAAGAGTEMTIRAQQGATGNAGGNLTIGPGYGGVADVNPPGNMTIALQSDGSASGSLLMTGGALGTFLTVVYNDGTGILSATSTKNTIAIDAASTVVFKVNGTQEAEVNANGLKLASGNSLYVDTVKAVSAPAGVTTIGDDAGGAVDIRTQGGGDDVNVYLNAVNVLNVNDAGVVVAGTLDNNTSSGVGFSTGAALLTGTKGSATLEREFNGGYVTTSDATTTTIASIPINNNAGHEINVEVIARKAATGDFAFFTRKYRVYRHGGGGATEVAGVLTIGTDQATAGAAAWTLTMDVSGNNARVRATGAAATDITWFPSIDQHIMVP